MSVAVDSLARRMAERPPESMLMTTGEVTGTGSDANGFPMVMVRIRGGSDTPQPCIVGTPFPGSTAGMPSIGTTVVVLNGLTPPWAICARATSFAHPEVKF